MTEETIVVLKVMDYIMQSFLETSDTITRHKQPTFSFYHRHLVEAGTVNYLFMIVCVCFHVNG